ncbi:MAG: alpha/beta hydrolase [Actinomycetota bacterium]
MGRAVAAACLLTLLASACDAGGTRHADVPPGELVHFTTDDGVELAGELRGSGPTGVILAHMFPTDRTSWAPLAEELAERGSTTLAFDFRGYGDSQGSRSIPDIWRDVLAAMAFLRERGNDRIVLIGASMGGTASLVAAAREEVQAVVTLSAASTFMGLLAPPEALRAIDEPKLFIAAQGDGSAAATAQQFYADSPPPKRVEIVNGDEHGTELLQTGQAEVVRTLILSFVDQHG